MDGDGGGRLKSHDGARAISRNDCESMHSSLVPRPIRDTEAVSYQNVEYR